MDEDGVRMNLEVKKFIVRKWDKTEEKELGFPPDEVIIIEGDRQEVYHPRLGDMVPE